MQNLAVSAEPSINFEPVWTIHFGHKTQNWDPAIDSLNKFVRENIPLLPREKAKKVAKSILRSEKRIFRRCPEWHKNLFYEVGVLVTPSEMLLNARAGRHPHNTITTPEIVSVNSP